MSASQRRLLAERLAAGLAERGTDVAFGVPGGGPNLDVVGAMAERDIRFVLAHGETAACIMASVYGYLTGRVSATVVTRGPGAASAANGAAQATLDRHPLVLITDTVPAETAGRVPHQRLDQRALFEPLCKASATMDAALTNEDLDGLITLATQAPSGAVHLDYDTSTSITSMTSIPATAAQADERSRSEGSTPLGHGDDLELDRILAMIATAERPVVIAGIGATNGEGIGADLVRLGVPVLTTYQAIGVVPSEHEVAAGLFTNGASERPLLDRADLIIAIGLDPVEPIPAEWTYAAPVVSLTDVHFDDPYLPIDAEAVGELDSMTKRLTAGAHRWSANAGADHRSAVRAALGADGQPPTPGAVTPVDLVAAALANTPAEATTTVDAGAHFLAIMPLWRVDRPKQLLISNGLATMGYALPAAIGAALARPDRPVLCMVGDGGLGMSLAELETVARLDLPVTVVVFNDSALSLIQIKQGDRHGGSEVVSYLGSDFAAVASGLGMRAIKVTDADDLAAELNSGWDRPRLIDVTVNPGSYPHLIEVTRG